jgi:hypothetical protein
MLGVVPYLVSLATGNAWVMLFGLVFTVADGGDALIWLKKLGTSSEGLFTEVPRIEILGSSYPASRIPPPAQEPKKLFCKLRSRGLWTVVRLRSGVLVTGDP